MNSSLTDLYQLLDAKLFAIVIAYLKNIIRELLNENRIITKQLTCKFIVRAWVKLSLNFFQEYFEFFTMEDSIEEMVNMT